MKLITVTDYAQLSDGCRVRCKIDGCEITDAKMSHDKHGWYVCQNYKDGNHVYEKHGFRWSWYVGKVLQDSFNEGVTDLCLVIDDDATTSDVSTADTSTQLPTIDDGGPASAMTVRDMAALAAFEALTRTRPDSRENGRIAFELADDFLKARAK